MTTTRSPLKVLQRASSHNARLLLGSTVLLSLGLSGCGGSHETEKKAAAPAVIKGAVIETAAATTLPESIELSGTVRARTSAMVSARVAGTVSVLSVREGDRVRKGQLLAQLEAQESHAQASAATSAVDEARRALDEAQARKRLTDATFERYQKLFKEQAVSRQEFEVRQTEHEVASQAAGRAESRLKQAQEGARAASTMSDYTKITAPIAGIVTARPVNLGATVFPAQPLVTIEDEGSYQLELSVPESLAARVKPGMPLQVALDSGAAGFAAKVAEIVPAADPATRTFIARVNLSRGTLKSGMFGRASLALGTSSRAITVASSAVMERGALTSVWVVDKDGISRMRLVKTGKTTGNRVLILSGLSEGERVISSGVEKVSDGAKVE